MLNGSKVIKQSQVGWAATIGPFLWLAASLMDYTVTKDSVTFSFPFDLTFLKENI